MKAKCKTCGKDTIPGITPSDEDECADCILDKLAKNGVEIVGVFEKKQIIGFTWKYDPKHQIFTETDGTDAISFTKSELEQILNWINECEGKHKTEGETITFIERGDGRVEWLCPHGVGHPIYAPKQMGDAGFIHGCDGCCREQNKKELMGIYKQLRAQMPKKKPTKIHPLFQDLYQGHVRGKKTKKGTYKLIKN